MNMNMNSPFCCYSYSWITAWVLFIFMNNGAVVIHIIEFYSWIIYRLFMNNISFITESAGAVRAESTSRVRWATPLTQVFVLRSSHSPALFGTGSAVRPEHRPWVPRYARHGGRQPEKVQAFAQGYQGALLQEVSRPRRRGIWLVLHLWHNSFSSFWLCGVGKSATGRFHIVAVAACPPPLSHLP